MEDTPFDFNTPITEDITLLAKWDCPESDWDPDNPTLQGLKSAIDSGQDIPIGIEIPDTYNSNSNPLIVAQKLDSTNNSSYGGAEGVILVRKYADPASQAFGSNAYYATSTIKNFLDTTYLENCSDDIKAMISDITVTCQGAPNDTISAKWFLMSGVEIGGTYQPGDGIFWDYWKEQTGLTSANNGSNPGRTITGSSGQSLNIWLRSRYNTSNWTYATAVYDAGQLVNATPTAGFGVLPACFIAKSTPVADEALTSAEYDNLDLTAQTYDNYDLTAEQYDNNGKNLLK